MTKKTKRNYYTHEKKIELLRQLKLSGMTNAEFARRNGIHPVTIFQWKRQLGKSMNSENYDIEAILLENEKLKKENDKLKITIGDLSVDKLILETAVDVYKKSQIKEKFKGVKKSSRK